MYAMTGLYAESACADGSGDDAAGPSAPLPSHPPRESIKCHSRNPSVGLCDRYSTHSKHLKETFTLNKFKYILCTFLFTEIASEKERNPDNCFQKY